MEYWVKQAVDVWVIEYLDELEGRRPPCTPEWIADQIARAEGIDPPQHGGINHIFRRWNEIGIGVFGSKPTRFLAYSPEAIEVGMDRMREKHSRSTKGDMAF